MAGMNGKSWLRRLAFIFVMLGVIGMPMGPCETDDDDFLEIISIRQVLRIHRSEVRCHPSSTVITSTAPRVAASVQNEPLLFASADFTSIPLAVFPLRT